MIRKSILSETPVTLGLVAGKRNVSPVTVYRWTNRGVNGILLESSRQGRKLFTSEAAVERFLLAINGGAAPEPSTRTNAEREAAIAAAEAYIDAD